MTLGLANMQRAIYLSQKAEIRLQGYAPNHSKFVLILRTADIAKYFALALIGFKHSVMLAIIALVSGFALTILFTVVSKDNFLYLKSKLNIAIALMGGLVFYILSALFFFPKAEALLLSNGLEVKISVDTGCDEEFPLHVEVKNNTYLTLERLSLHLTASKYGRSTNLIDEDNRDRNFDLMIKPADSGSLCYRLPAMMFSSDDLYWSAEIDKSSVTLTRDSLLEEHLRQRGPAPLPEGIIFTPPQTDAGDAVPELPEGFVLDKLDER